jgi:chaperonin GroEL
MKIIKKFDADTVRKAVNRIAEPIIQTITPLGNNVMFEKDFQTLITNDGASIAKLIDSEDEVEDAIIQMVKYGSLATNKIAGDGTSTTVLLTKSLVDLGLDQIASGMKPMVLKKVFLELQNKIMTAAESLKKEASKENIFNIAMVSSGGDRTLSENVVGIVETAGVDGMVFINDSKTQQTKIIQDSGYLLEEMMFDPILGNISAGRADYLLPHVFITDKKLYHIEECREILEVAHTSGVTNLVIVARDFLGEAISFLIGNHMNEDVPLNILLIKYPTVDNDLTPIYDLATYLSTKVVSEKIGSLKGKLSPNNFISVNRVYSSGKKTVFVSSREVNTELSLLIEEVRKKKEEDPDDTKSAKRLASLTSGTVTLEVGAPTGPELRELIYRYEDSINAARAALRSGYVVGGGLTLFASTRDLDDLGRTFGLSSIRQIAANCGIPFVEEKYEYPFGLNAKSTEYSNLETDEVVEPYDVFKYSVINAISIATAILTSGFFIVNKQIKNEQPT